MKKGLVIFFCLFFAVMSLSVAQDEQPVTVAVLDLNAPDISSSALIALSNIIRRELMMISNYIVVDREIMKEILDEQGFQQTGVCTDEVCMVEVGKILGVRKMIGGSIGMLGRKYIIDLKLVDVESGKMDKMETEEYVGPLEELDTPIETATRRLAGVESTQKKGSFIYVTSKPSGARVYLDGKFVGNAPINITARGIQEQAIRVTLAGYTNWEQTVVPKLDKTVFYNAELTKLEITSGQPVDYLSQVEFSEQMRKAKGKRTLGWIITVPTTGWAAFMATDLIVQLADDYDGVDGGGIIIVTGLGALGLSIWGISMISSANKTIKKLRGRNPGGRLSLKIDPKRNFYAVSYRISW